MIGKTSYKYLFSAAVIVVGGFILFNIAFLLAALIFNGMNTLLGLEEHAKPSIIGIMLYTVIILTATVLVFISKLNDVTKATFLTMPLMVALIGQGILLYQQPKAIPIAIATITILTLLSLFYKYKKTWEYSFACIYVGIVLIATIALNIEI